MRPTDRRPHAPFAAVAVSAATLLLLFGGVPIIGATPASSACSTCTQASTPATPSAINVYEIALGVETLDPAIASDSASAEAIMNIYQTLVTYDGNDTASFVPELASCVPGSAQCVQLFGSSLIANGTTGTPRFFTFAMDPSARFYDSKTGFGWPVYPSDVLFSLARLESFADLPYTGSSPGWILSQGLLPAGNASWDGGIHAPYNNTPQNVLASILVNDSNYCPAAALAANGCVTFDAASSGSAWPALLSLLASPTGGSIEPCGWFSFVGAGLPGFNGTTAAYGDGSCSLPGGANSSLSPAFQKFTESAPPTLWDGIDRLAASAAAAPQPSVQWVAVGSGPYYLEAIDPNTGYVLRASPTYRAPTGCAGTTGCEPLPGTYFPRVNVFYESNDSVGVSEYRSGSAAMASISPNDATAFDALATAGRIGAVSVPTLRTNFQTYDLNFSVANENRIDPTGQLNVPGDFFSYDGLRGFLDLAYPYASIAPTLTTSYGMPYGIDYGGAIPRYLGAEYPANISWPSTDPGTNASTPGSAAWYWAASNRPSSGLYDPELSPCSSVHPCRFPIMYLTLPNGSDAGPLTIDQLAAWSRSIANLSEGALQPYLLGSGCTYDSPGPSACDFAPGESPYTTLGATMGAPYADPTAVVAPMYAPGASWPYYDSIASEFERPTFDSSSCGYDSSSWSDLLHWANAPFIATACQGPAYSAMAAWIRAANLLAPGPNRTLVYNEVEHVANLLALYVYAYQSSDPQSYASWVNPATLNTNPIVGGEGIETWYSLRAVGPPPPTVYPVAFHESGLPVNTSWSASLNGSTVNADSLSIVFDVPNGTYDFSLQGIGGFAASPAEGRIGVNGTAQVIFVTYVPAPGTYLVQFLETGLPRGTSWSVTLAGSPPVRGSAPAISFSLTNGSYSYTYGNIRGYTGSAISGSFWVIGEAENITVQYVGVLTTYTLRFQESGLPTGASWNVSVGAVNRTVGTAWAEWTMPNGTYPFAISSSGFTATPASGTIAIGGRNATLNVTFVGHSPTTHPISSSAAALPTWAWAAVASLAIVAALLVGWILVGPGRRGRPGP